ncbi:FRG domain-containing protein [Brevundimonas sp. C43]|uniref:FRG domain-containing protein n=1 Tax=Brevundimonas sp. C43 TaxID=3068314 RepID=UPI003531BC1D
MAQIENEHLLLRDLVAMHPAQFEADSSALEMLVRMQHYALPTRLLDASWNPLVALYFACQPKKIRVSKPGSKVRVTKLVQCVLDCPGQDRRLAQILCQVFCGAFDLGEHRTFVDRNPFQLIQDAALVLRRYRYPLDLDAGKSFRGQSFFQAEGEETAFLRQYAAIAQLGFDQENLG